MLFFISAYGKDEPTFKYKWKVFSIKGKLKIRRRKSIINGARFLRMWQEKKY